MFSMPKRISKLSPTIHEICVSLTYFRFANVSYPPNLAAVYTRSGDVTRVINIWIYVRAHPTTMMAVLAIITGRAT